MRWPTLRTLWFFFWMAVFVASLVGLGVLLYWLLTVIAGRTFAVVVCIAWALLVAPVSAIGLYRAVRIRVSGEPYDPGHAMDAATASLWFFDSPRFWFALVLPLVAFVLMDVYELPLSLLIWGITWAVGSPGRELTGPLIWATRGVAFVCALGTVCWLWKHR